MHRDRDLDLETEPPPNAEMIRQDLELATLLGQMSNGDDYLREIADIVLLSGLTDPGEILYRQEVLADCLEDPATVRQLYELAVEGGDIRRNARFFWFRESPEALMHKSRGMLELLVDVLTRMRTLARDAAGFRSDGFTRFFATIEDELDAGYVERVRHQLEDLQFRRGTLISAALGRANRGTGYVLRKPPEATLLQRLTAGRSPRHSFTVPGRDEHGLHALSELRGRGIALVANALAQSTDHIFQFLNALRAELGFYVACLNLHEKLHERGQSTCLPVPLPTDAAGFSACGVFDASLVFHLDGPVVGSDVDADGKRLVLITGANQGGKTTFLRAVGVAHLLMQAGAFVPATAFRAGVRTGVFTHFSRGEDASMTQGKLDEELSRMSDIADHVRPHALLLCNESFAATTEREGSEIGLQVIRAMVDADISTMFVTHLFDLADTLRGHELDTVLFLRAERRPDGSRTFRMVPGAPLSTSHAEDSFRRVFDRRGDSCESGALRGAGIVGADAAV